MNDVHHQKRPELVLIAARARNGVIGRDNTLPWRLRADLAHFKRSTLGHTVLMGRKTWESLGRPLPGRRNLVVSRQAGYQAEGAEVFATPDEALTAAAGEERVFLMGGAELYRQLMPQVERMLLTEIDAEIEGDAWFPDFSAADFVECGREMHAADDDNDHPYAFVELHRR